jgi:chromosome segregation ATPase
MNHYYLLFGPAVGFFMGAFFAWFLMYSRLRMTETAAGKEKSALEEQLASFKSVSEDLEARNSLLAESRNRIEKLERQLDQESEKTAREIKAKNLLEEQLKKIPVMEKHINELREEEKQAAVLRQKIADQENSMLSLRRQFDNEQHENNQLREELKSAAARYENLSEKLRDLALLQEKVIRLEKDRTALAKENERLQDMQMQLKQLGEIKEMYNRTVEENQSFRNQDMARHLVAVKAGLQQSIKAFNNAMRIANNPLLTGLVEVDNNSAERMQTHVLKNGNEEILIDHTGDSSELKDKEGI